MTLAACLDGGEDVDAVEPMAPDAAEHVGGPAASAPADDDDDDRAPEPAATSGETGAAADVSCPRARIAVPPGNSLRVRQTPSTESAIVASLPNNSVVTVIQRTSGEEVSGNAEWFEIATESKKGFIAAAFAKCTADKPPVLEPPAAYRLPLACDTSARVSQGNNGRTSHSGRARYAFDFAIPVNTPLVAMADGVVTHLFAETGPGDPCYNGGGASCFPCANYVVLRHGDGSASIYKHLNKVLVSLGELVPSGKPVGLSGSTGYSTGPHAHVMRKGACSGATSCQSIPVKFADVPGSGVPVAGQTVKSKNGCP